MVLGRGLHPPGWAVGYQLAVVLTLAAAPRAGHALPREVSGQRTDAGDHPAGADARERPHTGLHGQAQCAGRSGRC